MARRTLTLYLVLVFLAFAGAVLAANAPVTVSPGNASELAVVEGRCPTFSWGAITGANGYELVAYRLGAEDEEALEALRQRFRGVVTSWTPSLAHCLERGGQYAWSVRAEGSEGNSEWSAPRLFEVEAGPSPAELEVALAAVREVLAQPATGASASSSAPAGGEPVVISEVRTPRRPTVPVVPPKLIVDGPVLATEYQIDTSGPTKLATDAALAAHAGDPNAHAHVGESEVAASVGRHAPSEKTIGDLSCTEREVPTFLSGSWDCALPYVLVTAEIVPDTLVEVHCPTGTELVSGGIGGPNCSMDNQTSMCQTSSMQQDCFLVNNLATSTSPEVLTGAAACEVSTVGTPPVPWTLRCECFAVCR